MCSDFNSNLEPRGKFVYLIVAIHFALIALICRYCMGGNCFSTEAGAESPILVEPHLGPFPTPEIGNNMASAAAPVVINATAKHTATVFFMHGLGDTG